MKSLKTLLTSSILILTASTMSLSANANLLTNGGFENPDVAVGHWQWFNSAAVPGWDGSNVEIWDHLTSSVNPYEGEQFAELNAHPSNGQAFTIFQSFATTQGQTYDVSFAYRARVNSNEAFSANILDSLNGNNNIANWILNDHTTSGWSVFSNSFKAESAESTISFTTITPLTATLGNFIDDVNVSAVSEPATFALLGLGLVGLGLSRRRLNK